jgi:hypothetical protein
VRGPLRFSFVRDPPTFRYVFAYVPPPIQLIPNSDMRR